MTGMGKRGESSVIFNSINGKRGQVTIFIIIAVVIVALGAAIYLFYPQISSTFGGEQDANSFIQTCIEDEIQENVETVSLQGGGLNPELHILYLDEKIEYLCYTEKYSQLCIVQRPLLDNSIESEIENGIEEEVKNCFSQLQSNFESRGYDVTMREGDIKVELLPQRIVSTFNYTVTFDRAGETQRYESFNAILNNNLYELIGIANNIIDWESTYGNAETTLYMDLYHNLKVEKKKPEYGTDVYILTERTTGDKFQFATRSLVTAPGYGIAYAE